MKHTREMNRANKAQTLIEYALIFGIVIMALTAMRVYLQRGIQGVIKISADQIGLQQDGLGKKDLEKGNTVESNILVTRDAFTTTSTNKGHVYYKHVNDITTQSGDSKNVTKIITD